MVNGFFVQFTKNQRDGISFLLSLSKITHAANEMGAGNDMIMSGFHPGHPILIPARAII
jgi:hypothetical protein